MATRFWGEVPAATPVAPGRAQALARELFGVEGRATPLGSNQETNLLLEAGDRRYVLKVANPAFGTDVLDLQNAAMRHLAGAGTGLRVPEPVPARDGTDIAAADLDGVAHHVRLLTYVPGRVLADARHLADPVLGRVGALAARVGAALADFDHPAAARDLQYDPRRGHEVVAAVADAVPDPGLRARLRELTEAARAELGPLAAGLRSQVVHADLADYNLVAGRDADGRPQPDGVIDFGDVLHTWLVGDLATAVTSLLWRPGRSPLLDACAVVAGYHAVRPLGEDEVDALWPLVLTRAAVLVACVEDVLATDPANGYAREERPVDHAVLERVAAVPPALAREALRRVTGHGPSPAARAVAGWRPDAPVLTGFPDPVGVDLSVRSGLLDEGVWTDPHAVRAVLETHLGDRTGLLRHGEARLPRTVTTSAIEPATVSLVAGLTASRGGVVRAPTACEVREVGPHHLVLGCGEVDVVIRGVEASVSPGRALSTGEAVGRVSSTPADSALPPAVSVQVGPAGTRAPELAEAALAPHWLALCPDPAALLGLASTSAPEQRPAALLARRERVVASVQEHYYAHPPQIERGWRSHLIDTDARSYLDVVNNVAVLGHSHPAVTAAATRQLRLLNTNSRFLYDTVVRLAERIVATLPEALDTVLFVNSGSEAVDLALRLVRTATGRRDVVCLQGGYHGWTTAADEVSTTLNDNPRALGTRPPWVHLAPMPNLFRGEHRGPEAGDRWAAQARAVVEGIDGGPAGFIAEPLSGNAGGVQLPRGYLAQVYAAVRAAGGLCIADEVQVGYGRTGSHFWGFQAHEVVPDVLTMAKAAGNGHPLGFVVTRREVAEAFGAEGSFFSSVGGSPVSSAVGLAVLDTIRDEDLQGNAQRVGAHLRGGLLDLAARHPLVGTVHGYGLYLGVELVRDADTLEPATAESFAVCERLRELGVLTYPTGDHSNVLKVKPPLCLTVAEADFFVDRLDQVLREGW